MADDIHWMQQAIRLAETAANENEVPVGAVLIHDNQVIGEGYNRPIKHCDPSAHAEILALRAGALHLNNYRLINTTLYVTLEPCIMCLGALVQARIKRLVFGAYDKKAGALVSAFSLGDTQQFNHRIQYEGGLLADACAAILSQFFKAKR